MNWATLLHRIKKRREKTESNMKTCNYAVAALFGNITLNFKAIDHTGFFFSSDHKTETGSPHCPAVYREAGLFLRFVKNWLFQQTSPFFDSVRRKSNKAPAAQHGTSTQFCLLPQLGWMAKRQIKMQASSFGSDRRVASLSCSHGKRQARCLVFVG